MEKLDDELKRAQRTERFLSIILMDIDHFSNYNNNNGHPEGDKLLTKISALIKENTREIDIIGRYGGEEIIVLLPDANINEALPVAERIRKAIENYPFANREKQPLGKVTTCIGLVSHRGKNKTKDDLIKLSDDLLYKSKKAGRNKTSYRIIDEKSSEILQSQTHQ